MKHQALMDQKQYQGQILGWEQTQKEWEKTWMVQDPALDPLEKQEKIGMELDPIQMEQDPILMEQDQTLDPLEQD